MLKKKIAYLFIVFLFNACAEDEKECNSYELSPGASDWFTAIENKSSVNVISSDSFNDVFELESRKGEETNNSNSCPIKKSIYQEISYSASLTSDYIILKVSGPADNLTCRFSYRTNNPNYFYGSYHFAVNNPGPLGYYQNTFLHRVRYIGDTSLNGKLYPSVYQINPPIHGNFGSMEEMYLSKTHGVLAWKIIGEHNWIVKF